MRLYFDSAYVAKCYLNEPDAPAVQKLATGDSDLYSSALCRAEVACVLHRHVREGALTRRQATVLGQVFATDVRSGIWSLVPVSADLLERVDTAVRRLAKTAFLRAGDAIHLVSAREAGFREIWTNDRHLLSAAPHFGLRGRSV